MLTEKIVNGASQANGGSWGVHIDGAAAILKLMVSRKPQGLPATRLQMMLVLSVVRSRYPSIE